jgi:hypothetical protein
MTLPTTVYEAVKIKADELSHFLVGEPASQDFVLQL